MDPIRENDFLKYARFNTNTLHLLISNVLFFNHISNYNDPAEVLLDFDFSENHNAYKKLRNSTKYLTYHLCLDKIMRSKETKEEFKKSSPTAVDQQSAQEVITDIQSKYRCCSMTKAFSSLMFAHYADSHKGICIVLDGDLQYFRNAKQVKYDYYFQKSFTGFVRKTESIEGAFLRKSKEWKYENEYRILKLPSEFTSGSQFGNGYYDSIPKNSIRAIILGCRMRENDLTIIQQLKKKKLINCKLFISELQQSKIKLKPWP